MWKVMTTVTAHGVRRLVFGRRLDAQLDLAGP